MKKLTILLIVVLTATASIVKAQTNKNEGVIADNMQNYQFAYRLFPTQNIWTFIKLDTRNGLMWQVQYSMTEGNRFTTFLNLLPLVNKEEEKNGRFTLYPTQNIYNFILLDQLNGKTWQVQWSADMDKRMVTPIP